MIFNENGEILNENFDMMNHNMIHQDIMMQNNMIHQQIINDEHIRLNNQILDQQRQQNEFFQAQMIMRMKQLQDKNSREHAEKSRCKIISQLANTDLKNANDIDILIKNVYNKIKQNSNEIMRNIKKENKKLFLFSISNVSLNYDYYNGKDLPSIPLFCVSKNNDSIKSISETLFKRIQSDCRNIDFVKIVWNDESKVKYINVIFDLKKIKNDLNK